ncbi:MAG: glycogen synthase GlgA [bacterium]
MGEKKLKILFAASEIAPLAKTGGLADVAGSLPAALAALGHEVKAVMPFYKMVKQNAQSIKNIKKKIEVPIANRIEIAAIDSTVISDNVETFLIRNDNYYGRDGLYQNAEGDYKDNAERFIFFSRAILEMVKTINFKPDIIHCNDWQTGLIPTYLKTLYRDEAMLNRIATIFSIHNLGYQGLFWALDMPLSNLPWDVFTPEGLEFYGKISYLKAGIVYSDLISTVSKGYSNEIQTPEYGLGMEGVLQYRKDDLYGILNGADYQNWSPKKDQYIAAKYDEKNLDNKLKCKMDLLKEYNLKATANVPVIGMISRLADQKGFDILTEKLNEIMKLNIRLVLLGTGDKKYHDLFTNLAKKYPQKLGVKLAFDNTLAHKIEAGSDMYLMPSKYEPCGLNQIYSLRYGTIPIVRATGGLDDTIIDLRKNPTKGNGFKFSHYTGNDLLKAVKDAVAAFRNQETWKSYMVRCMGMDYSWKKSAKEYINIYKKAITKHTKSVKTVSQ